MGKGLVLNKMNERYYQEACAVMNEVKKVVIGKDECVRLAMAAILAGGHILIDDIPGVGKTTLAMAFAGAMEMDSHRMQFTPDVLPADILGFSMYEKAQGAFVYQPGAIMCNLFLADEINRTSPKTQSALLEVMEERQASVEGKTWALPDPFFVIATQNPSGSSGTQFLPESQLDRFMICLSMGYPSHQDAVSILKGEVWKQAQERRRVLTAEELKQLQKETEQIYVHDAVYDYIVSLVEETRKPGLFAEGASPRASIALLRMARAMARLEGRDFVTAQDVQSVLKEVLGHRVKLGTRARAEGMDTAECIRELILNVKSPRS